MRQLTVREALREAIREEMARDNKVFIIGEEVGYYQGAYKVTQGLLSEFGSNRIVDTPITEHGFTGLAVGAAFAGLRPIVEFMTFNFSLQAIDQIINSAAKTYYMSGGTLKCPIVFRGPNGAAARVGAQHSQNFAAIYSHIPGLKVIAPYDAEDFKGLLISAIRCDDPVVFLENEILYGYSFPVSEKVNPIPFGQAKICKNGADVTIISFSLQVKLSLEAATALEQKGIKAEVIDLRSIKPIDKQTIIESVKKTNRVVIVEEGWLFSGIGASISYIIMKEAFDYLDAPIEIVAAKDVPLPYAVNLEQLALPSSQEIIQAVEKVCYFK